jgi:filamentous hemagglutinin
MGDYTQAAAAIYRKMCDERTAAHYDAAHLLINTGFDVADKIGWAKAAADAARAAATAAMGSRRAPVSRMSDDSPVNAPPGPSRDDYYSAATAPYNKSGLSNAARAWDKHGRPGGTFPPLGGNTEAKNQRAGDFVLDALTHPDSTMTIHPSGTTDFRLPDQRGVRFNPDGTFSGYLDPPNAKP